MIFINVTNIVLQVSGTRAGNLRVRYINSSGNFSSVLYKTILFSRFIFKEFRLFPNFPCKK